MGTKDTITKDYMADNRVFADVFNHMLYKGKNIMDPDTLHPLDTTALASPTDPALQKFLSRNSGTNSNPSMLCTMIQGSIFSWGLRTNRNLTTQCRSKTWSMMH